MGLGGAIVLLGPSTKKSANLKKKRYESMNVCSTASELSDVKKRVIECEHGRWIK